MSNTNIRRRVSYVGVAGIALASVVALGLSSSANAATVIDGPVNLGTAAGYAVLAGSAVTNTGPSVIAGDVGLSPKDAISGFGGAGNGSFTEGTTRTDPDVDTAKSDLTIAYNTAASLTPQASGLSQLAGKRLTPGVYSGGALDLSSGGKLILEGGAESVWVFQAASTLVTGTGSNIQIIGGASICNVFWQVGSSATLGGGSTFVGTVMADQSVSVGSAATVQGRLLASVGAVTLINDTITRPAPCNTEPGTTEETDSPEITSDQPDDADVDTPYTFTVTATGTPPPTFDVTDDSELPPGVTIGDDGVISGVPTTPGTFTFTVTATNDTGVVTAIYTIVVADVPVPTTPPTAPPTTVTPVTPDQTTPPVGTGGGNSLAATGFEAGGLIAGAVALLAAGLVLRVRSVRRRS